jgi:CRISPR system Cascade subunit CasC
MLIQMHMLQSYAPANLNRDDTGAPKDTVFGGSRRGRISSQCLKRSIRKSEAFARAFQDQGLLGTRTRLLPDLIKAEFVHMGVEETIAAAILDRVPEFGRESARGSREETVEVSDTSGTSPTAEARTAQLMFIGPDEIPPMAQKLLAFYQKDPAGWRKAKIQDITVGLGSSQPRSVDIAMFGRMTTSAAFEDVQAAVQVAHALSTHTLAQEFDYYTAVDDFSGEAGAGMIGDIEFNSSTYYKYFNVHWEGLVHNLGGDNIVARRSLLALVEAAATAHPTGKQNSFAAFNPPDFVLVEISKRNLPVSYANAFLKPARARGDSSLMDASVDLLKDYSGRLARSYNLAPSRAFLAIGDYQLEGAAVQPSLADLQAWVSQQLPE